MSQYWIQIPVENAREVVQRKVDELAPILGVAQWVGATVKYDQDCEVILYGTDLVNTWTYDRMTIYFGTFILNQDSYINNPNILIESYTFHDFNNNPPMAGHYPYTIWNDLSSAGSYDSNFGYFVGYKFTIE